MRLRQIVAVVFVVMSAALGQQTQGADQSLAGRQASTVTVRPLPTPAILEGNTGIAARYPGDVGIEKDPDVVFVESFEGSVDEICRHWEVVAGKSIISKSRRGSAGERRKAVAPSHPRGRRHAGLHGRGQFLSPAQE